MISRIVFTALVALAAHPALGQTSYFTTDRSLYAVEMTTQPVPDTADASLARRDQFAVMTEEFAKKHEQAAKQEDSKAAVARSCSCGTKADPPAKT
jgi:hypothetical protein